MEWVVFGTFSLAFGVGAGLILAKKKLIYNILGFLTMTLAVAGYLAMLGAEIPAVAQILAYSGGLVVLLLFAMMLTGGQTSQPIELLRRLAALLVVGVVFWGVISLAKPFQTSLMAKPEKSEAFARILFDAYMLPFELMGVLLLLVVMVCMFLAFKK